MSGNGIKKGSSAAGPFRLMISTEVPPFAGRRANRSGAGEGSCAHASGRSIQNQVSVPCAARCRRLRCSFRVVCCHSRTAPNPRLFSNSSVVHKASAVLSVSIHTNLVGSTPQDIAAMACGIKGGLTRAILRFSESLDNTGLRSCSSPIPGCCSRSSTKTDRGHPSSGNSSSKLQ